MQGILKYILIPIHPEGWPFIGAFAAAALILALIWSPLGWIGLILTVWCCYFFRNPERVVPNREGLMISPADGFVQMIVEAPPPPELEMGDAPRTRISVFMSVFDVHVNRTPIAGTLTKIAYKPGKFLNATLDKASEDNERMSYRLALADGRDTAFVQIAGLVARRIKCFVKENDVVRTGERIGLIRFGSRVDIYLPEGVQPLVAVNQLAIAGETVLADLHSPESARHGDSF